MVQSLLHQTQKTEMLLSMISNKHYGRRYGKIELAASRKKKKYIKFIILKTDETQAHLRILI